MAIKAGIIFFIGAYVSYYPVIDFLNLKVTNKKLNNINNPISNKVIKDYVPKLLKILSLQ